MDDLAHAGLAAGSGGNAARCPACGRANACAIAAGLPPQDCWCMSATVSPAALARLPDALRGSTCLCPACAAGLPPDGTPPGPAPI